MFILDWLGVASINILPKPKSLDMSTHTIRNGGKGEKQKQITPFDRSRLGFPIFGFAESVKQKKNVHLILSFSP